MNQVQKKRGDKEAGRQEGRKREKEKERNIDWGGRE